MRKADIDRKGIILAGGLGTRLYPCTKYVCKQLLPVYNKPMIHYPLYTLLNMGIRDILVITTPETAPILSSVLGDCSEYGAHVEYAVQERPEGIAQSFIIAKDFIADSSVCLILGDNIFYGSGFDEAFRECTTATANHIIGYRVSDPERYGVVEFDSRHAPVSIEEKPKNPKSNVAVTGIYFYNSDVVGIAEGLRLSDRGELEITDINNEYLRRGDLRIEVVDTGNAYLDTGTFESLNDASNFVRMMETRTGIDICNLDRFKIR